MEAGAQKGKPTFYILPLTAVSYRCCFHLATRLTPPMKAAAHLVAAATKKNLRERMENAIIDKDGSIPKRRPNNKDKGEAN